MNRSRTVGVGLVAALSLALFPAASFAAPSQSDSSSGDASIMAPSNPSVSQEDREAADAQQAELDARAARPAPQALRLPPIGHGHRDPRMSLLLGVLRRTGRHCAV